MPPRLLDTVQRAAGMLLVRAAELRRPRLSLGVRLVAFDAEGRVFLVRHSYLPGLHLPGGGVDPAETCRAAAIREAREEGGLAFDTEPALFAVYHNPAGGRRDHVLLYVVHGATQPAPHRPSLEIRDARFHPLDALPEAVTPATRTRLAEVLGRRAPSEAW